MRMIEKDDNDQDGYNNDNCDFCNVDNYKDLKNIYLSFQ